MHFNGPHDVLVCYAHFSFAMLLVSKVHGTATSASTLFQSEGTCSAFGLVNSSSVSHKMNSFYFFFGPQSRHNWEGIILILFWSPFLYPPFLFLTQLEVSFLVNYNICRPNCITQPMKLDNIKNVILKDVGH